MFSRRLIVSIFMLPILLCLIGWGWSTTHWVVVGYGRAGTRVAVSTTAGTIEFVLQREPAERGSFGYENRRRDRPQFWPANLGASIYFGFYAGHQVGHDWEQWVIRMPYWFLILADFGILLLVWRKTRPKPSPATAFPVQIEAKRES